MGERTAFSVYGPAKIKNRPGTAVSGQSGTLPESVLTDGDVPIDNSASERSIRTFCIGKKNWMFHNTANGASANAMVYSISETAKLNSLRPYYYFRHILTELPKRCDVNGKINPAELDDLMPWSEELPDECRKSRR